LKLPLSRASLSHVYPVRNTYVLCLLMSNIWSQCLQLLHTRVNDHSVATWLDPIICESVTHDRIVLSVPNNFFIGWIQDNYLDMIKEIITDLTSTGLQIDFRSRNELSADVPGDKSSRPSEVSHRSGSAISDSFALKHRLNPLYTFESFVVGKCNDFSHAAAVAVSEKLAGSYNPLFIYADVGLGKTHLMSSIGYAVLSKDKTKKVYFTTSEEFTNETINAIQHDKMAYFRNKYRHVDLLLIDDIQFLARKERTQEEFFHTFNSLYENRKQIVITCDRFHNEISGIEERLKSRFGWGLVADMTMPELETRVAILKRKAYEDSVTIPDDVAFFLAEQADSNIRELVGSLIRLVAMSTLQGMPMTLELAEKCFKEKLNRPPKTVTVDEIISHVSKTFDVKVADIKSRKKHKLYSRPRQVAMYLARDLTELSYPEIGQAFGGKDHSTVIYATRKIEKELEKNRPLKSQVEGLKKDIKG